MASSLLFPVYLRGCPSLRDKDVGKDAWLSGSSAPEATLAVIHGKRCPRRKRARGISRRRLSR